MTQELLRRVLKSNPPAGQRLVPADLFHLRVHVSPLCSSHLLYVLNHILSVPQASNMTQPDPFDVVLTKFGLDKRMQDMGSIRVAPEPVTINNTLQPEAPCRIQGFPMTMSDELRDQIALTCIKYVHSVSNPLPGASRRIRPISLIVDPDGTVQAEPIRMLVDSNSSYPARYRIPQSTISGFESEEQVWRSEKFALGTLLYEIYTHQIIFDGQSDDQVRENYRRAATFPDIEFLPPPIQCLIYACWSAEFGCYLCRNRFTQYITDNPVRFALQVTGGVASTALFAVPILGAIGFSAIGPVAGTAAAGWQASIGAVQAGSLFAFCQSAAMGGAAATAMTATGISGAAVAAAATGLPNPPDVSTPVTATGLGATVALALPANPREAFIRRFLKAA